MASTDIVKSEGRGSATRPPTGLLLSIGDTTTSSGGREIPTRIDHFRPKEGQLAQYTSAMVKFGEVYGAEPKELDDLFFLSNNVVDCLSIRLMAWGSSGPRLVGDTNYASLPRDEWEQRAFAFDDDITYFPLSADEVRKEIRDDWQGEPIRGVLEGPNDPRIEKLKVGVECTLTFCLPKVMGFGTVAQITTKGKRSMRNLVSSLNDQHTFFQGQLIGIPFRLTVRPAKTRRFNKEKREYTPVHFFELVLDTPFTVQEAIEAIAARQKVLGGAQPGLGSPEARALTEALALPPGPQGDVQLRDEPDADVDRADDATINRIVQLEQEVGHAAAMLTLRGVFGVDSAGDLNAADATRYKDILSRAAGHEEVTDAEFEVIDDPDDVPWPEDGETL